MTYSIVHNNMPTAYLAQYKHLYCSTHNYYSILLPIYQSMTI